MELRGFESVRLMLRLSGRDVRRRKRRRRSMT